MADEEGQIKRARLIGPKNYKNIWQKMHYERAQAMQKAREEAERKAAPKSVVTPMAVSGAPRPEFGPPVSEMRQRLNEQLAKPVTASGKSADAALDPRFCYGPPIGPRGVSAAEMAAQAKANGDEAATHPATDLDWFRSKVDYGADWDYKKYDPAFEPYGNYHYGYVGTRQGIPAPILRAAAGLAQVVSSKSSPRYITTAFDEPADQEQINRGIHDALKDCF